MSRKHSNARGGRSFQGRATHVSKHPALPLQEQEQNTHGKIWTLHDLADIRALTPTQQAMSDAFTNEHHVVAYGSPGTGKTFLGLYLALREVLCPYTRQTNIIIVRSAVQSRDIGFTPGTLEEKMALYETPYRDILYEIVGRYSAYDAMKDIGLLQFYTTSFLRGLSWNNAVVLFDEIQNCAFNEIYTVLTRLGEHSRFIIMGDISQNDLERRVSEQSGMEHFLRVAETMQEFRLIKFTRDDIVRSSFVKNWIIACENMPRNGGAIL